MKNKLESENKMNDQIIQKKKESIKNDNQFLDVLKKFKLKIQIK